MDEKNHAPNAQELVAEISSRPVGRPALTFYTSPDERICVSYGELARQIAAVEARICDELCPRLSRGSTGLRVGLVLRNNPQLPATILALLACGCSIVPINPDSYPAEISFIAQDSKIDLLVVNRESRPAVEALRIGLEICDIDELARPHASRRRERCQRAEKWAVVMYTSGTTSRPKGVMLSEASLFMNGSLIARHFELQQHVQLTTLPMYHAHAFHFGVMSSLLTGGHLVVLRQFDPVLWPKVVRYENVHWTSVVPSQLPLLLAGEVDRHVCPSLKGVLVSSAAINEPLARQFETKAEIPIIQGWGQTEYTCWATICSTRHSKRQFHADRRSVGTELDGVKVDIYTDDGSPAVEGEEGELLLSGPSAMLGYIGLPELSQQTLSARGLRTGDRGYFRLIDGERCFFITGRIKELINRGGEKLSPLAIEEAIYAHFPACSGYIAVVGFDHRIIGEEIGILIDAGLFSGTGTGKDEFLGFLGSMHNAYRPRVAIVSNEGIAKTFTGKVQRTRLKEQFKHHVDTRKPFTFVDHSVAR
jgi:long-chain acyl-CoA synthetase